MPFSNPIVGGVVLIRPAIQSPDYLTGVSGWSINKDGSAEFNDITIRGGTTTQGSLFMYNGIPTFGNLIASIAPTSGVDEYGNAYRSGFTSYGDALGNDITTQLTGGELSLESNLTADETVLDFTGVELNDAATITKYLNTRTEFTSVNDHPIVNDPGGLLWAINDGSEVQRYLRLTSGDDTTHDAAFVWLFGEDIASAPPYIRIDNGAGGRCDADISGSLSAGNMLWGTVQTAAPGAGGGVTNASVVFSKVLTGTPRVMITVSSAASPETTVIRAYVSNESSTGFDVSCYRSTNAATNIRWFAVSD